MGRWLLILAALAGAAFLAHPAGAEAPVPKQYLINISLKHGDPLGSREEGTLKVLAEPRLGLAMLVGALIGIPGASYIAALHNLVAGNYSPATRVAAVVVFVVIDFLLIIIPFAFLELRPEATKALLKRSQDWLLGHALQLMAGIALILGAYLTISALVRLS